MATTKTPMLRYDQIQGNSEDWTLIMDMRTWPGYDIGPTTQLENLGAPIFLPSTSIGQTDVWVFENKSTALALLRSLRARRVTFCGLGEEGEISVLAVGWTKLLVYDTFCPYLQRLFQTYQPCYTGGQTWFINKFTSEAETFTHALRTVGKFLPTTDPINDNYQLKNAHIHLQIVDANWRPAAQVPLPDGSGTIDSPIQSNTSEFDDTHHLLAYIGVWPNGSIRKPLVPGEVLRPV